MPQRSIQKIVFNYDDPEQVFDRAAALFRVMSAPMRLKILRCLCDSELNVNELLSKIHTTQPNMSQHLKILYKTGVIDKRREGVQIYYRIANPQVVAVCKSVCLQVQQDTEEWVSP
jgi:DNA-binding transcriptional ArsR family regulator